MVGRWDARVDDASSQTFRDPACVLGRPGCKVPATMSAAAGVFTEASRHGEDGWKQAHLSDWGRRLEAREEVIQMSPPARAGALDDAGMQEDPEHAPTEDRAGATVGGGRRAALLTAPWPEGILAASP